MQFTNKRIDHYSTTNESTNADVRITDSFYLEFWWAVSSQPWKLKVTEQIVVSPVKIFLYIFLCAIFLTFGPQFCHRLRYPLLRSLFRSRSFEKETQEPVRVVEVGFILECTLLVYPGKCRFLADVKSVPVLYVATYLVWSILKRSRWSSENQGKSVTKLKNFYRCTMVPPKVLPRWTLSQLFLHSREPG